MTNTNPRVTTCKHCIHTTMMNSHTGTMNTRDGSQNIRTSVTHFHTSTTHYHMNMISSRVESSSKYFVHVRFKNKSKDITQTTWWWTLKPEHLCWCGVSSSHLEHFERDEPTTSLFSFPSVCLFIYCSFQFFLFTYFFFSELSTSWFTVTRDLFFLSCP